MSRSRRRGGGPRRSVYALLGAALIAAAFFVGVPGSAYTTGETDRAASVSVVDDIDATTKLNVTTELQEGTDGQCLVEITNRLGTDVTVNVSLRNDSTHLGELQREDDVLGLQQGDSIEFSLANGGTKTVNMNVNSGTAGNTTYFHVNATTSGLRAELTDRSAPIVQSANTSCA